MGLNSSYLLFSFERQQSLVQEQLAKLAQQERESATTKGLDAPTPAFSTEKEKASREQENAKMLVRDVVFLLTYRSHNKWSAGTYERKTSCILVANNIRMLY